MFFFLLHLVFGCLLILLSQAHLKSHQSGAEAFFRLLEEGLANSEPSVPFKGEYLHYNFGRRNEVSVPSELHPPPFVRVHEFLHQGQHDGNNDDEYSPIVDLAELSRQFESIVDQELVEHGAVLFRNMPMNASDFSSFWNNHVSWPKFHRMDPFYDRMKEDGIDLAPRTVPESLIRLHNEQTYNPYSPEKVLFYCLGEASEGGETLLLRNEELTDNLDPWIMDFVRNDGHVVYDQWVLYDAHATNDRDLQAKSWQKKTGASTVHEAIKALVEYGFDESDITIDEQRTIRAVNKHPNRFMDEQSGRELWLDSIIIDRARRPNGEELPRQLHEDLELADWASSYAFKMKKGDLLVLDNYRVAHGRLPYRDEGDMQRKLMTCYA
jgi:Taurine catabolism dioxygenase TauD, TfdA family